MQHQYEITKSATGANNWNDIVTKYIKYTGSAYWSKILQPIITIIGDRKNHIFAHSKYLQVIQSVNQMKVNLVFRRIFHAWTFCDDGDEIEIIAIIRFANISFSKNTIHH